MHTQPPSAMGHFLLWWVDSGNQTLGRQRGQLNLEWHGMLNRKQPLCGGRGWDTRKQTSQQVLWTAQSLHAQLNTWAWSSAKDRNLTTVRCFRRTSERSLFYYQAVMTRSNLCKSRIKYKTRIKKKNWTEAWVATHFGGITTQGCYNVPPEHHMWQTLGDSGRNRTTWSTHTGEKPSAEATLREPGTKMSEDCKAAIINMLGGLRSSLKGLNGSVVRVTHQLRKISKETEMPQEHQMPVLGWSHPMTKWKTHSAELLDC